MKNYIYILVLLLVTASCNSQTKRNESAKTIGGPCEDCDALFDYKILNKILNPIDTIQEFENKTPKIKITGTVFERDGKTPVENVILYVYQTNQEGFYEPNNNPKGRGNRHGKFRSWMKTDQEGTFSFYTFRPSPYPDGREPAHIHLYIKEPNKNVYYLDNYIFTDDPLLTEKEKNSLENRGGSGVVTLKMKDGILTANRDIILGMNIPNY